MSEVKLYNACDFTSVESSSFLGAQLCFYTHRSPEKETVNEDSLAVIPFDQSSGVLVVADGLGGSPKGDVASLAAIEHIAAGLEEAKSTGASQRDGILNGLDAANKAIISMANGCATTLALVEMRGNTIRPYHVGDAMALVVGQRGKSKLLTMAHSPVGYAVESGMLDVDEALHHQERNIVSNVVGAADMRVEMGAEIELARYDTLLIASDGLFDNFYIEELVNLIRKGHLLDIGKLLVSACQERMQYHEDGRPSHPDDMSFILLRRAK